jgi:hypothetical protein
MTLLKGLLRDLSDKDLREERSYWDEKVRRPSWGVSRDDAIQFRKDCETEMGRRGLLKGIYHVNEQEAER